MEFIYSILGIVGLYSIVFSLITLFSLLRRLRAARFEPVTAEITADDLVLLARIGTSAPAVLPFMIDNRREDTHPARITLPATLDYMPIIAGLDESFVPPMPARAAD